MAPRVALAILTATLLFAGCGGDDEAPPQPAPKPPPKETREPLPDRPKEWKPFVNERGGFAVLLPRGWKARNDHGDTLIRSFDHLVAISITADRSAGGLEIPVDDYAGRTAAALRGFERPPRIEGPRSFRHPYDGAEAYGTATARGGIRQRVSVIVLRRPRLATFTAVLAANAKHAARESERIGRKVVRTLRARPPRSSGQGAGPGGDHNRNGDDPTQGRSSQASGRSG